jgi:coenzyme PQQ synthesis protein D (PqqD)
LRQLKRGASVQSLARELVARYNAAPRSARSDALNFVRRLRRMGLVDAAS